jgi:hypothetical protein
MITTTTTSNKSKASTKRRSGRKNLGSIPSWVASVANPFDSIPSAIPDQATQPSCKAQSRGNFSVALTSSSTSTAAGTYLGFVPFIPAKDVGMFICTKSYDASVPGLSGTVTQVLQQPPNTAAIMPGVPVAGGSSQTMYNHRMTALGIRVINPEAAFYAGGTITIGLSEGYGNSSTSGGHFCNAYSLTFGTEAGTSTILTRQQFLNRMRRYRTYRLGFEPIEAIWIPMGTPQYIPQPSQALDTTRSLTSEDVGPYLHILVESVPPPTVGLVPLEFEWVANWEIIPSSRVAMAIPPTPSVYNPQELADCLNTFESLNCSHYANDLRGHGDGALPPTSSRVSRLRELAESLSEGYSYMTSPQGRAVIGTAARLTHGAVRAWNYRNNQIGSSRGQQYLTNM